MLQVLVGRSGDDLSFHGLSGPMTGAIPCLFGTVPDHGASHVRAGRIDGVEHAVIVATYSDLFIVQSDDHAFPGA